MLRIQRSRNEGFTNLALCGRVGEEHLQELQNLLAGEGAAAAVILDLEELRLVDRSVVRFLADCESRGIKLKNCPSYVREWIDRGADDHEP
jgi:anti-anti-sigma regulatory factor